MELVEVGVNSILNKSFSWGSDFPLTLELLISLIESAKLRALRAHVPTCLACLRDYVPTCLACLRAHVPTCLHDHVPCVLKCSNANVLISLHASVLTCERASSSFAHLPAFPAWLVGSFDTTFFQFLCHCYWSCPHWW